MSAPTASDQHPGGAPPTEAPESEPRVAGDVTSEATDPGATTAPPSSKERGMWGWRNRLMNWRSGSGAGGGADTEATEKDSGTNNDNAATSEPTAQPTAVDTRKPTDTDKDAADASAPAAAAASATPARPMNIWLRRALERQAESAIAEALRDGKPVPEAAAALMATTAAAAAAATSGAHATPGGTAATNDAADAPTSTESTTNVAAAAPPKTSFAELMRKHREGLLAPVAQPPVKATKVVKKPKPASPPPAPTPAAAAATTSPPKPAQRSAVSAAEAPTAPATEATAATEAVHQTAVRKRAKATSTATSAKRANGSATATPSAAASAIATPTHVTTVKGKTSLEELRARRNRATPTASEAASTGTRAGGDEAAPSDEYNDGALDAVSRLLLRYCLGGPTSAPSSSGAAATDAEPTSSDATADPSSSSPSSSSSSSSSELEFFNELMEMFKRNQLTPASLELLRELFQHVRVLPRPAGTGKSSETSDHTAPEATADTPANTAAGNAGDGQADAEVGAAAAAPTAEIDMESYREAARRREYVQQVIMVLLNRLQQMKIREQQQQRQQKKSEEGSVTATAAAGVPPQPILGRTPPSQQQQQHRLNTHPTAAMPPMSALPMAAYASPYMIDDDAGATAAAFTTAMVANGYPNPYAHLTVFSQHQPVAPPLGWPAAAAAPHPNAPGPRRNRGPQRAPHEPAAGSDHSVAARLVASPFPGAFPIIPPPATTATATGEAEDNEMQELFRLIRTQLTQPFVAKSPSGHARSAAPSSRVESCASLAPVVSQAERVVLRQVQLDFKQQQQQQQQKAGAAGGDSPLPSSPTPPGASTPRTSTPVGRSRLYAMPEGAVNTPSSAAGATGVATVDVSPSMRSTTAPAKDDDEADANVTARDAAAAPTASPATAASTLRGEAKPFVPSAGVAATADSTPTKTTFHYGAKPFVPSGGTGTSATPTKTAGVPGLRPTAVPFTPASAPTVATNSPAPRATMNAAAPAFVPHQPQPLASSSFAVRTAPGGGMAAGVGGMPVPPVNNMAGDPWASYEMFTRWRDMMEAYYQGMFDAQSTTGANGVATATATAAAATMATAGQSPSAMMMMMTPPRSV